MIQTETDTTLENSLAIFEKVKLTPSDDPESPF